MLSGDELRRLAEKESPGFVKFARAAAVIIVVLAGVCLYLLKR